MRDEKMKSGAAELEVFVVVCGDVFIAQDAMEILREIEDMPRVIQAGSTADAARIVGDTSGRVAVVLLLPRGPIQGTALVDQLIKRDGVLIVLSEANPSDPAPGCRVIYGQVPFTSGSLEALVRRI